MILWAGVMQFQCNAMPLRARNAPLTNQTEDMIEHQKIVIYSPSKIGDASTTHPSQIQRSPVNSFSWSIRRLCKSDPHIDAAEIDSYDCRISASKSSSRVELERGETQFLCGQASVKWTQWKVAKFGTVHRSL